MGRGGGETESNTRSTRRMEIEVAADSIDTSLAYHVLYDVMAFLLHMHQQIPSMLQDVSIQYDSLKCEHKELEIVLAQTDLDASTRRKSIGRKRDVRLEIKRFDKLMNTTSALQTAFKFFLFEVPRVEDIVFVFGASPRRPQHVYEISFPRTRIGPPGFEELPRSRSIELVSRKVIRALISKGVGSTTYTGPSKLFLLVRAPASFSMPLHFLPKREFQFTKKIVPFRLQLKSRISYQEIDASHRASDGLSGFHRDHTELTWFQCRHVIKGLTLGNPEPDE